MRVGGEGYPALAVIVIAAAGMLALPVCMGNAGYVLVGDVDIGDISSEEGFGLEGWGTVVVPTSGWGSLDGDLRVVWEPGSGEDGRSATITFPMPEDFCGSLQSLRMHVLDGQADDGFIVSVYDIARAQWNDIFEYVADTSTVENWYEHTIYLTEDRCEGDGYCDFPRGYPIYSGEGFAVKITATGDMWSGHSTYGQLAVDWMKLEGNGIIQ